VLARHDGYHVSGLPKLSRLVCLPMSDPTARTTALRNGEIDVALDATPKDARVLRGADGVRVDAAPGTFWEYVGLNTRRKPLDDVRVRRAIAWAIDRDAINRVVKLGGATVLDGGHIPSGHWAHADGLHLYPRRGVEEAKQLLRDAGVADGLRLVCKVGSAFPYQVAAGQMVKQQLRDVGIDVQLLAQESGVFFQALGDGDFDLTVVGWVGFVDPDEWTFDLFHSKGKWNQQGYASPRVDALLERGRTTADRTERERIYREAQRLIANEAPMVFLYANPQAVARLADVENFVVHPTAATIFLREAHFAPAARPSLSSLAPYSGRGLGRGASAAPAPVAPATSVRLASDRLGVTLSEAKDLTGQTDGAQWLRTSNGEVLRFAQGDMGRWRPAPALADVVPANPLPRPLPECRERECAAPALVRGGAG
ncbi:MAG TPA: ABC transporter substrate-binding protein, partial [Tepidisphaeraceae bacterium]|nr:ABC transporter substrate-binding protein [Tepidisphaeraceae bacterium]